MSKFVVIVFPDEKRAYDGVRALNELHNEGSLTIYSDSVIQRGADGSIEVKETRTEGPVATGVGALVGGLIGMLAGPVGAAAGLAGGSGLGALQDLMNLGVSIEFLQAIGDELAPGRAAIVTEVSEEWVTPLDSRMEAIGGVVMREWRDDFIDDEIQKRIEKRKADLAQRRSELAAARQEKVEAIKKNVSNAEQSLRQAADTAKARAKRYHEETEAKIQALQDQAKKSGADAKARIEERISEIRADQKQRTGKLEQAWKLTQEALRP